MPRTAATTKTVTKNQITKKPVKSSQNKISTVEEVVPVTKSVARRTAAMKEHPSSQKVTKTKPVANPSRTKTASPKVPQNRIIATDNPNLLDPHKDGSKKIAGMTYNNLAVVLGFGVGTEQFLVALELLKGGETRSEINDRVKAVLPTHTVNGTVKQVTNLVSAVHNRMLERGFRVTGSYKLVLVKGSISK